MTHSHLTGLNICDRCHQAKRDMIETWWAIGWKHYCDECWPHHRDYYESESGRQAWRRVGNSYVPNE